MNSTLHKTLDENASLRAQLERLRLVNKSLVAENVRLHSAITPANNAIAKIRIVFDSDDHSDGEALDAIGEILKEMEVPA